MPAKTTTRPNAIRVSEARGGGFKLVEVKYGQAEERRVIGHYATAQEAEAAARAILEARAREGKR